MLDCLPIYHWFHCGNPYQIFGNRELPVFNINLSTKPRP